MYLGYADFVDGKQVRADRAEFAGPSASAAFNSLAYNAKFTEAGDRAGCLSRKTLDGRGERVFITASPNPDVVDAFIAYRVGNVLNA